MSTRAVITVIDANDSFHIYTHHDSDPADTASRLAAAGGLAWPLPRFKAGDWAAALVAAAKPRPKPEGAGTSPGGSVYLTRHWRRHRDLAWRYEVRMEHGAIAVRAFEQRSNDPDGSRFRLAHSGTLDQFVRWAGGQPELPLVCEMSSLPLFDRPEADHAG